MGVYTTYVTFIGLIYAIVTAVLGATRSNHEQSTFRYVGSALMIVASLLVFLGYKHRCSCDCRDDGLDSCGVDGRTRLGQALQISALLFAVVGFVVSVLAFK